MAQDVPVYQKQLNISGSMPQFSISTAPVENWQQMAQYTKQTAQGMEQRAVENATIKAQTSLVTNMDRIEREHQNDPDGLQEALKNFHEEFAGEVDDENLRAQLDLQFERAAGPAVTRAVNGRTKIVNDQARFDVSMGLDTAGQEIQKVSRDIFSSDPALQAQSQAHLQEIMSRVARSVGQVDSTGEPLLTGAQRAQAIIGLKDHAIEGSVLQYFDQAPDKMAALNRFKNGELTLNLPNLEGGFDKIDTRDAVSQSVADRITRQAEATIVEQETTNMGAAYATGQAFLNPADSGQVKVFNKFFDENIGPVLATMPPEQQIAQISKLIDTTKVVPTAVQGQIRAAARSKDIGQVQQAASLIDTISNVNPNLLQAFDQGDISRLRMVNNFRNGGYSDADAISKTDEALKPGNQQIYEDRKRDLSKMKIDFKKEAIGTLQTGWFARNLPFTGQNAIDTDGGLNPTVTANMGYDYQRAYEAKFQETGDKDLAETHAKEVVGGTWGNTQINGRNQVMKFAPEKFYGIDGVDNKWIRQQAIDDAHEMTKGLKSSEFKNYGVDYADLDKNLIVMTDPYVTPRTAAQNEPVYRLGIIGKDGAIHPLTQGPAFFKPDKSKVLHGIKAAAKFDHENQQNILEQGLKNLMGEADGGA